ncbi:MAG: Gfo/Idh/MocA family protein [Candidatus Helarchaeota archaeon]
MNKEVVNFGLIGIGQIGQVHAQCIKELANSQLVAAYHPNSKKLDQFSKKFQINNKYTDLNDLLNDDNIDVIDICTPTHTHFEFIEKSIKSNKKVLVEKPITRTLEEFDKLMKIINNKKDKLMVAQYCRFIPEYQMAKKIVMNGDIGIPVQVNAYRHVNAPTYKDWFFDENLSGGIILDLMIHDIDATIWILDDEIESVFAVANNFLLEKYNTPDSATVIIKFKRGTIAAINGTWILPKEFYTSDNIDTLLHIFGTKGVIEINDRTNMFMKVFVSGQGFKLQESDPLKTYKSEINHFSECILRNRPFNIDFNSIRASLDVCLKALESYKLGTIIKY